MWIWAILTVLSQLPHVEAFFFLNRLIKKMIQGRGDKKDSRVLT